MGKFGTTNGSKNGSKPWFSKNDPSPVVVPKLMNTLHFEPFVSRFHPLSSVHLIGGVTEVSKTMFLPPRAWSQYSILVRFRVRVTELVELVLVL